MAKPYQPPRGRIATSRRSFEEVVRDLRYAVFSVVRFRAAGEGKTDVRVLGSGFFVSPEIFLTCQHVVSPPNLPHQDGDTYNLVNNVNGLPSEQIPIEKARAGDRLHLFPECDVAILICAGRKEQAFAAIERECFQVGRDIGVAGYPMPRLLVENNQLRYDGLLFRVAKGVVTSTYPTQIKTDEGQQLRTVGVLEFNFLFVPGNSGGPVFDSETGRVNAFVHGYTTTKIREKVEAATLVQNLPEEMSKNYIENLNALYSLAITLDSVWDCLNKFGV